MAEAEGPVKGPSPRGLWKYAIRRLRLAAYFCSPGDGRLSPQIPAQALVWSIVIGCILRQSAFGAIEAWVNSSARRALGVSRVFGDDALRYFTERLSDGTDRVELWEADDFDPCGALRWQTVRVIRYRQHKPGGEIVEVYWLTNLPRRQISRRSLYAMAKSRWQIENQGFNDAKNRYGLEHICDHHPRSLLLVWLLTCLALTLERLYRLRYLHRGTHSARTPIELLRLLLLTMSQPSFADSS